jgi:hypothetical protein
VLLSNASPTRRTLEIFARDIMPHVESAAVSIGLRSSPPATHPDAPAAR